MTDTLRIVILGDGTIRTETDAISGANHQSAEDFLKGVTLATGGEAQRTRRAHAHGHVHHHDHAHVGTDGAHTHNHD